MLAFYNSLNNYWRLEPARTQSALL